MAGEVSYEVTGVDDVNGLLVVTYTQGAASVETKVMWDGVRPIAEFLKEACPFRLLAAKLTPPNIAQAVGTTGTVDLPPPQPELVPPVDPEVFRKTPPPPG